MCIVEHTQETHVRGERWRTIPGYDGEYRVSNLGRIYSVRRMVRCGPSGQREVGGRILKPSHNKGGYCLVALRRSNYFTVHRLVLRAFVGECPEGMIARHLNGNPVDASLGNLAWGTYGQNMRDRDEHGNTFRGEDHKDAKLTMLQVREIRAMRSSGLTHQTISERMPVTRSTVQRICSGELWTHVENAG